MTGYWLSKGIQKWQLNLMQENEDGALDKAIQIIRSGGIVAFPTDTVYGIGQMPLILPESQKLYNIKKRDAGKPIAILLADFSQLPLVCSTSPNYANRFGAAILAGCTDTCFAESIQPFLR